MSNSGTRLAGRVALVTGSGRNIGRATVLRLAADGADVVVNARTNEAEAQAVAAEARALGVRATAILADVADREAVDAMVSAAIEELGRIDILINNAAVRPSKPFAELTDEVWERVRGVVLDGALYCTRAVVPSMIERGSGNIQFIVGGGAFSGGKERAHVSAAKMGLVGLSNSLARELGPHNIRVNVVSPGLIDTSRDAAWYPKGIGEDVERKGTVGDIAAACAFLASDDAAYITGQTLHVNGGHSAL